MFIHGTEPGILDIDRLMDRVGLDWRISRSNFLKEGEISDRLWGIGIYDEHTFEKANETFKQSEKPFFAIVFSLTSHTPYVIPPDASKVFGPEVEHHQFLNSLSYSDKALGKFFKLAKGEKYFKDTLFIIMADHTEGPSTIDDLYENHHIPCLIYSPGMVNPGRYDQVASHMDILPTIYDLLKLPVMHNSWGKSIYNSGKRIALIPRGEFTLAVSDPYMLLMDFQKPVWLYNYRKDRAKILDGDLPKNQEIMTKLHNEALDQIRVSYGLLAKNRIMPPQDQQLK
jgi:phosphoglycerol transferase MdoB-like AlkP superfamily enzyme